MQIFRNGEEYFLDQYVDNEREKNKHKIIVKNELLNSRIKDPEEYCYKKHKKNV